MPAIDILLTLPAANADRAETAPDHSDRPPPGDDFVAAMKKALAPKEKSPADKPASRATSTSGPRLVANQAPVSDANASEMSFPTGSGETGDGFAQGTSSGDKKNSAEAGENGVTLPDGVFPIIDVAPAPPIFFTVPLNASVTPPPVATIGSAPTKAATLAVASDTPATGTIASPSVASVPVNELSAANSPVMSTLVLENSPVPGDAFRAEPALTKTLAAEVAPHKIAGATPLGAPAAALQAATPGNFILPAAQFAPVVDAVVMPETVSLPAEISADVLKEVTTTTPAGSPAVNAGTGVATTGSVMKKTDKATKIAGLDVQNLPGAGQESPRESVLMPRVAVTAVRAAENYSADFTPAFAGGETGSPLPASGMVATAFNPVELPSLTDARLKSVERTHDMVALHAMRLVESKSDVLSVVIKPAVGTELTLELRQRDGSVEALAMLSRGDYQLLNQHWPELQQRLEQRGIKLAPLGGETNFSQNNNHQQQQRSAREEAAIESAAAFAEFASVGGATARRAMSLNGWESWA